MSVDEGLFTTDSSPVVQIRFISDKQQEHWLLNVLLELENPRFNLVERRVIGEIED